MYTIVYIVLADTVAISARIQRCNGTAYDTALIISGYLAVLEPSHDNFPIHKLTNNYFILINPEHQTILYNWFGFVTTVYRPVDLFMNFPLSMINISHSLMFIYVFDSHIIFTILTHNFKKLLLN